MCGRDDKLIEAVAQTAVDVWLGETTDACWMQKQWKMMTL